MSFAIDPIATLLVIGISVLIYAMKKRQSLPPPHFIFSSTKDFELTKLKDNSSWLNLPSWLYRSMIICFILAFMDPHLLIPQPPSVTTTTPIPTEGLAIYLILDRSGSMSEPAIGSNRASKDFQTKMRFLKQVTQHFIENRPSDLMGIVAFARVPQVLVPLTLDQQTLQDALNKIDIVQNPEEDGTAIGYALFKTAHLIAATRYFAQTEAEIQSPYDIKNAIIILVTDGLQDPSTLDRGNRLRTIELDEAAAYLKKEGIKLYLINIDPKINTEEYAPHRRQLERITKETGGQFFIVNHPSDLQQIYTDINQIEKSRIYGQMEQTHISYKRISFYPILIGIGLLCLFIGWLLESTIFKRGP